MRGKVGERVCASWAGDPFRDEKGLTTVGMVLALLVTLSLVFSAGQVYRLNTAASEVQAVADAAALAAENEVAEFMIAVRVCDAVVLSLSLTSLVATGLGVAALCTPATATASETLLSAGRDVARARDAFAEKAAAGLNRLQRLLPFFAVVNAASVASANNGTSSHYFALAVLVSSEGETITVGAAEGAAEAQDAAEADADELRRAAEEAERSAQQAAAAKQCAFEHDCGASPSYCMYERASTLASLSGTMNPLFKSVDTWSFSVALKRAQAYYPERLAVEAPEGPSVEDQARSALRARFYAFAIHELEQGYVRETADSFDAFFPRLPRNTDEMRGTDLYTEAVYPCGLDDKGRSVMHAWEGCPGAKGAVGRGSLAQMEAEGCPMCEQCGLSAASMGKVAAASTSIENGFEYHYDAVADAAEEYERAQVELEPLTQEVKLRAGNLIDQVAQALGNAASMRIDARPPGSSGVVVLVANTGQTAVSSGFRSSFIKESGTLGTRVAVSAATLVADPSGEGSTVVSSLLDGFAERGGASVGMVGVVLDCWSGLLQAYASGQEALDNAISSGLEKLPLAGASGLGIWAAGALRDAVSLVGLEPAQLDALKPLLVNSAHVASAEDEAFSVRLLQLKEQAIAYPLASNDVFLSVVGVVEQDTMEGVQAFEGKVEIATIEILGEGGPSFPIEISLPPAAKDATVGLVAMLADGIRSAYVNVTGVNVWE